jgi:hypothetical protein
MRNLLKYLLGLVIALVFLAGGALFVGFGAQTITVRGTKTGEGSADFEQTRTHLWGVIRTTEKIEGVAEVRYTEGKRPRSGRTTRNANVALVSGTEELRLLAGSSATQGGSAKAGFIEKIRGFLENSEEDSFSDTVRMRSIPMLVVGLPLLLIGLLFVFVQTTGIIRSLRTGKTS